MTSLLERLLEAFAVEHREHLKVAREILRRASQPPSDVAPSDIVELYRRLHSLKGAARAADLRPIEALSHSLESLVARVQAGDLALDGATVAIVVASLDAIEDWFSAYSAGSEPPALDAVIAAVAPASGSEAVPAAESRVVEAEAAPAEPPIAVDGKAMETWRVQVRDSVHVDVESLDRMLQCTGEMLIASGVFRHVDADFKRVVRGVEGLKRDLEAYQAHLADGGEGGAAIDGDRLRAIHEMGIRVRGLATLVKGLDERQRASAWHTRQLTRRLHSEVQQVRMVPADSVVSGLGKMVRDIAADQRKQVEVRIVGGDTRADRVVLQQLRDPLVHILRNAIDHGIEMPDERRRAGKPETGTVTITVAARGSRLELQVADDGRGLDLARIEQAAREAGHLDGEGRFDPLSALVQPGVSTSESVTELSGRGLGLSVVHQTVASLQGDLALGPGAGGGLVLTISVPLSIGATSVVLIEAGGRRVAIPAHGVQRVCRVAADELKQVEGRPLLTIEGENEAIAVVNLDGILGGEAVPASVNGRIAIVILRSGGSRLGVSVDGVLGVREVVVEPVGEVLPESDLVVGTIVLEDGRVTPLLNPVALMEDRGGAPAYARAPVARMSEAQPEVPVILVVDDSITTRTLEKSILEASGYRVRLSVDGLDALEQLRSARADLVVTDIEMPRMDGFDLLREMKRDRDLREIPVVLVTSLGSAEHQRRGLSLGADAYVVKHRFDQTDLLDTIGQLL